MFSCFSVVSRQAPLATRVSPSVLVVATHEISFRMSEAARIFVPRVDLNATPRYHLIGTHWSSSTVLGDICVAPS